MWARCTAANGTTSVRCAAENCNATENAISAVTKICKFQPQCVANMSEVHTAWLTWLPVWEDTDEAEHVYGYLCELIEA